MALASCVYDIIVLSLSNFAAAWQHYKLQHGYISYCEYIELIVVPFSVAVYLWSIQHVNAQIW